MCGRRIAFFRFAHVIMADHWHTLIWPRPPLLISRTVQSVKWQTAGLLNRRRGVRGAAGQHPLRDRFVGHEHELIARLDYMYHNPVRKGLVKRIEDWRLSSYRRSAWRPAANRLRAHARKTPGHKSGAGATRC